MIRLLSLLFLSATLYGQWTPGDVYREYIWTTPAGDGEAFLRVGGRYGYAEQVGKLPDSLQVGDQLVFPQALDLTAATHATLTFEKVLGHEDSRDLRVAVNGHTALSIPEPADVPEPQTEYMYHTDVTVEVPLAQLHAGHDNRFALTLDTAQRWGWPQNLFYAVILRVHYPSDTVSMPVIDYPDQMVPSSSYLYIKDVRAGDELADYVFIGHDVDWSGRGVQDRIHWQTHRGEPLQIIGRSTARSTRFAQRWNTEWLPTQEGFAVQARVLGADGKYRVGPPLRNLTLAPRPYTVAVYGGEAPRNWVTRSGAFEQSIQIDEDVETATALQVHWVSWSPCYSNGVFLNGHLIWDRTDDCYVFATHSPQYTGHDVHYLQSGENMLSTALTPLFRGEMVHGMEVQWPGMQLRVRYGK
ncbi:hypothetical protein [Neolewinella maritima]|uniref:hypothetical protein n=1 Tax=Neolewinella maritima TaxID=1383882 RepID=UPI001EE97B45|nr:hypothetical protein [Neolewinella maritima]